MADIKGLIKTIEEYNKKYTITENSSEADKLIAKMHEKKFTKEDYFEVEEEVKTFLKSMHLKQINKKCLDIRNRYL